MGDFSSLKRAENGIYLGEMGLYSKGCSGLFQPIVDEY